MFEGWGEYYLLVGGASGALIGLLFVVVTLTSSVERSMAQRGAALYITPTVFHFATVLTLSGVALAPHLPAMVVALILAAGGLYGLAYAGFVLIGIRRPSVPQPPHWTDPWCYALFPGVAYLVLVAAGAAAWRVPACAPFVLAVATMLLLLVAIRNAWDLVTWLAPRAAEVSPPAPDA
jgi:hypothetical protein